MTRVSLPGLLLAAFLAYSCTSTGETRSPETAASNREVASPSAGRNQSQPSAPASGRLQTQPSGPDPGAATTSEDAPSPKTARAYFAGGCFWCMESSLEQVPGILEVISGYSGGRKDNPTYHEVGSGSTGHAEAVEVLYDPSKISYAGLLDAFWHNIDPFAANRQFCDAGNQYRAAIFYQNEDEHRLALESLKKVEERFPGKKVVTEIVPASKFYVAEEYHQDYYKKNPEDYLSYRTGCGRDRRLKELWGDVAGATAH
jgi:peptide-methionine (S)-S-oxide reductase